MVEPYFKAEDGQFLLKILPVLKPVSIEDVFLIYNRGMDHL